jgi:hypothetical protein
MLGTCNRCERQMCIGWWVRKDLWLKVPAEWHNKVLCIECFLAFMTDREIVLKPEDFEGITFFTVEPCSIVGGRNEIHTGS